MAKTSQRSVNDSPTGAVAVRGLRQTRTTVRCSDSPRKAESRTDPPLRWTDIRPQAGGAGRADRVGLERPSRMGSCSHGHLAPPAAIAMDEMSYCGRALQVEAVIAPTVSWKGPCCLSRM